MFVDIFSHFPSPKVPKPSVVCVPVGAISAANFAIAFRNASFKVAIGDLVRSFRCTAEPRSCELEFEFASLKLAIGAVASFTVVVQATGFRPNFEEQVEVRAVYDERPWAGVPTKPIFSGQVVLLVDPAVCNYESVAILYPCDPLVEVFGVVPG